MLSMRFPLVSSSGYCASSLGAVDLLEDTCSRADMARHAGM